MTTEKTKVIMTLWIADKKINGLMKAFDMCHNQKVFISKKEKVVFYTSSNVNRQYIQNIIEKSREQKTYWIPAIEWNEDLYVAEGIKEISDGKRTGFVRQSA